METLLGISCLMIVAIVALWDNQPKGKQTQRATIYHGDLKVTFRDNSESPRVLSGIGSLFNVKDAPFFDAYDPDSEGASGGMNLEHIICGHADAHNAFSPRHGEYNMYVLSDEKSVLWHRKAEDDPWGIESITKITVTPPHYLDIEFACEVTNPQRFGERGYAILFWCNYMNDVAKIPICFRGKSSLDSEESWVDADASQVTRDWDNGGTYRHIAASDLPYDDDHNFKLNIWSYEYPRYTRPFYYGLLRHGMVYMLMFDRAWTPEDEIRFSIFKFKLKQFPRPAWDYQYVIRRPQPAKAYGYHARVVWKKFISPEDCMTEYDHWVSEKGFNRRC